VLATWELSRSFMRVDLAVWLRSTIPSITSRSFIPCLSPHVVSFPPLPKFPNTSLKLHVRAHQPEHGGSVVKTSNFNHLMPLYAMSNSCTICNTSTPLTFSICNADESCVMHRGQAVTTASTSNFLTILAFLPAIL